MSFYAYDHREMFLFQEWMIRNSLDYENLPNYCDYNYYHYDNVFLIPGMDDMQQE